MSYRITYVSPQGHVKEIAHALCALLPEDTPVQPLSSATPVEEDAHLIGIELGFRSLEKLPEEVETYVKQLSGKRILFFCTVPFFIDEVQRTRVHTNLSKALPWECDYCGMYLCMAQPEADLLEGFHRASQLKPESTRIRHWLKRCEYAQGHPNNADLENAKTFVSHVLMR